jgi:hypothetical protein
MKRKREDQKAQAELRERSGWLRKQELGERRGERLII